MPRNPAAAAARRRRASRRIAESGPAPEHQLQLQPGLTPPPISVNFFPATGRQERFELLLAAGRLHRRLPPLHQHLQRQLEPQQQHISPISSPTPPTIPPRPTASPCPTMSRSTTACPPSRSATYPGPQRHAAQLLHLADHLVLRGLELDSRQAQYALWRRLPPRAPRLSCRLQRHREASPLPVFSPRNSRTAQAVAGTGSSLADFLLGLPQATSLNSSLAKSYLRDNVYDAYAMDDWRVLPSLTLNYGVRWEFFAPYTEKYSRLADVAHQSRRRFSPARPRVTSGATRPARFARLSLAQGLRAARGACLARAEGQEHGGARRLRHELHRRRVRRLRHHHGAPAALHQ